VGVFIKTALITGASSGIGLNIAKSFAKAGYSLALTGLESTGHEFAKMLKLEYGVETFFEEVDFRNSKAIRSFGDQALKKYGPIAVLVNNAGIQHVEPFETFSTEKWDAVLNINLSAVFHMTQSLWISMKEARFGRIINISSVHGLRASEFKSAYVAAKHGVVGLTKVLALEGAPFGITANAICPGYVRTPLVENQIGDQMRHHGLSRETVVRDVLLKKQAVKDFIPQDLISETALFLASEGSGLLTGTSIPIDGAWTSQ
jgi:3-hydroxybutyrate dehydrogenase